MEGKADETAWDAVLAEAIRGAEPGTELFFEEREHLAVELDAHVGHTVATRSFVRGIAARRPWNPEKIVHRSDPDPQDADKVVGALVDPDLTFEPAEPGSDRDGESLEIKRGRALVERMIGRASREAGRVSIRGRWSGTRQQIRFASDRCGLVKDLRQGERVRLEIAVESSGSRGVALGEAIFHGDAVDLAGLDRLVDDVFGRAEVRLRSVAAGSGRKPVVFAPGVGGVLVHELVGHALEADTVLEGGSWLAADGRVGGRDLSVVDDPRRARVAWEIDDEGNRSGPVALIRDGRVAGALHDARTSRQEGGRLSGHGRCSSYREPVRPRMGCTFMAPGTHSRQEVFEGIDDGLYIRRMERATTDPRSGRAVFRVSDADRIRFGSIDVPVDPFMLVVRGPEALAGIDRVASDLAFDPCVGSCVKHGQALAVSVGAPTFRAGVSAFYS